MSNRRSPLSAAFAVAVLMGVSAPVVAQTPWNRSVDAVTVTPAPVTGGPSELIVYYRVDAEEPLTDLDLGLRIDVFVNGVPAGSESFPVTAHPSTFGGCFPACPATGCLCCDEGGTSRCTCEIWRSHTSVFPLAFAPGAIVDVVLVPTTGSEPEIETADDVLTLAVPDAGTLFWNRRIDSVDLVAVGRGLYDLEVGVASNAVYDGLLDLAAEIVIEVNGEPVVRFPEINGHIEWDACGEGCVADNCAYDGESPIGHCAFGFDYYDLGCGCNIGAQGLTIPGVRLDPGDEVLVRLEPAAGALPEITRFADDDIVSVIVPTACTGDLDGNGRVDFGDILVVLGNWGPCD